MKGYFLSFFNIMCINMQVVPGLQPPVYSSVQRVQNGMEYTNKEQ